MLAYHRVHNMFFLFGKSDGVEEEPAGELKQVHDDP